ncbi:hypothetical protein PV08_07182 [Exophiala spinifera]|uniref:Uncharacterized protein n=1 Tax=Exophiala spinifera TaxID=91928 RepID=A0A0D2B6U6_9EURO|nr:uncharacterized protein PV08_07182 [Exophiala spinifera]KIW14400.1 hypothetical protein PV08_07182 [Exophiala spinifera]
MNLTKRRASFTGCSSQASKRAKLTSNRLAIVQVFNRQYSTDLGDQAFISLCAYLIVILDWGYQLDSADYDLFILEYPMYEADLPSLYSSQLDTHTVRIPSYHKWFESKSPSYDGVPKSTSSKVLSPSILSEIATQHPYSVALTETVLMESALKTLKGDQRRSFWLELTSLEEHSADAA